MEIGILCSSASAIYQLAGRILRYNKNMDIQESAKGFRQNILESLDQFAVGFEIASQIRVAGEFKRLVVSGMGGSALPAGLVERYAQDVALRHSLLPVRIIQNRTYSLPFGTASDHHLHVICSYSGNTEESLSCLEEAIAKGVAVIGVSAGGKLEARCQEKGVPHVKLPIPTPTFQPRMGTGYFFGALVEILINHNLLPDVRQEILEGAQSVKGNMAEREAAAQEIVPLLKGKTPVVYSSDQYGPVAMIWKIKINENAKTPAFWNTLPEMNHNEMVGYTLPQGPFHVLLLRDPEDDPRNKKRYEVLLPLLEEKGVTGTILDISGESVYTKVFNTLLLGDFIAYHLALAYDQDPEPVAMVEAFKKLL